MPEAAKKERMHKIGDVCRLADVQPYVLRYWETEFPALAPSKSGGGQRVYSQREVDIVLRIKQLLYSEGFTIAGAKKKLELEMNQGEVKPIAESAPAFDSAPAATSAKSKKSSDVSRKTIVRLRNELRELLAMLQR